MNGEKTIVVNEKFDEFDVYIGRGSLFGNPFKIGVDGIREEVIEKYKQYFYNKIVSDFIFRRKVMQLEGLRLGCFCKPLPCHGDVIVKYLEGKLR